MASIPTSVARQRAIDRLIKVLQEQYATEIAATVSELEQTSGQLDDLLVDAPTDDAYYYTPESPDSDTAEPIAHSVAVFFIVDGPRRLYASGSYGASHGTELRVVPISVVIMVRQEVSEPITRNSKELSPNEVLRLRTEVYTGALVECVLKYACEAEHIHQTELVDDDAALDFIDETMVGVGGATFEITQKTQTPRSRALP